MIGSDTRVSPLVIRQIKGLAARTTILKAIGRLGGEIKGVIDRRGL